MCILLYSVFFSKCIGMQMQCFFADTEQFFNMYLSEAKIKNCFDLQNLSFVELLFIF